MHSPLTKTGSSETAHSFLQSPGVSAAGVGAPGAAVAAVAAVVSGPGRPHVRAAPARVEEEAIERSTRVLRAITPLRH